MTTTKPSKTLADYMVIAISPALIMVMVHSVCFFLVDIFYRGEAIGGVRWVLFWFVLAVVLITRIGIEQGDTNAMVYGLLLAAVTWMYLSFAQFNPVFGAFLLAIVWFTAHKITSNCTLVDDDADASGQGLMQSFRALPQWLKKRKVTESAEQKEPASVAKSPGIPVRLGLPTSTGKKEKTRRPQTPGAWLLYFGIAALPVFGLGQTLLPAGDTATRHRGFIYLFCYLAAALGLLITTSFLGLRRYLRQRYLTMPGNIAFGWIQYGVIAAAIVLCLSLLLPRPGAGAAWGALRYHIDYQIHRASQYAARFNPHGTGPGKSGNQPSPGNDQQNNPPQSGQSPNPDQNQNTSPNGNSTEPSRTPSSHRTPGEKGSGENSAKPLPTLSPTASTLYPWLKALFYLAVGIVAAWLLYRYRVLILTMLRNLWAALLGLFKSSAATPPMTAKTAKLQPFKMYKSPFLTGADRVWPPEELIIYSYHALQSWALEQEDPRDLPQTPREFCRKLAEEMPEAAPALDHLAFLYGHVAYNASVPGNYNPENLRLLWNYMSSPRPKPTMDENLAVKS